jgi:hypothetical protein
MEANLGYIVHAEGQTPVHHILRIFDLYVTSDFAPVTRLSPAHLGRMNMDRASV